MFPCTDQFLLEPFQHQKKLLTFPLIFIAGRPELFVTHCSHYSCSPAEISGLQTKCKYVSCSYLGTFLRKEIRFHSILMPLWACQWITWHLGIDFLTPPICQEFLLPFQQFDRTCWAAESCDWLFCLQRKGKQQLCDAWTPRNLLEGAVLQKEGKNVGIGFILLFYRMAESFFHAES